MPASPASGGSPRASSPPPPVPPSLARALVASRLGRPAPAGPVAYQLPHDRRGVPIAARLIDSVHAAGAQVHVWTVNEVGDMRRLLEAGVDGIVTDRPDLLNERVGARSWVTCSAMWSGSRSSARR